MRTFLTLLILAVTWPAFAFENDQIKVSLVSEHTALEHGRTNWVGVWLQPEKDWHVYWKNPGDSGQAPKIDWQLPPGISVGDILWPVPEQIPVAHLMNYGYHKVLLMVPVSVGSDVALGSELTIDARVRWLVCREVCIPGRANLQLTLPVANTATASPDVKQFALSRQQIPVESRLSSSFQIQGEQVVVELYKDMAGYQQLPKLFPLTEDLVNYTPLPKVQKQGKRLLASFPLSDYFSQAPSSFEFVIQFDRDAIYRVSAPLSPKGKSPKSQLSTEE
ncbi:hypothetical protein KFE80_06730 [bacterium SCSIO 12696]|nr:hypothetical protein KFE80_06730 [bacterium SCSIO 12696]